jgi:hypothetical protein
MLLLYPKILLSTLIFSYNFLVILLTFEIKGSCGIWWLMPLISVTQEVEIRRVMV